MPPRSKPGELPKPVLKTGVVGALPVNALTLSGLHQETVECLLGFRDNEQTLSMKARSSFHLTEGKKKTTVSLSGRFYNGYSDALYRGQLPEVILAAPAAELLPDFLNDFVDYIEKLAVMGFFIPGKQLIQKDAVGELIPCTILTGSGLLFSRFITGLMAGLKALRHEHPALDDAMRLRIVGRFVRGFPGADQPETITETLTQSIQSSSVPLCAFPQKLRIAGGDNRTQHIIQSTLGNRGIQVTIENQSPNPAEKLELENALWRLSDAILPGLIAEKILSESEAKTIKPQLTESIWTIGLKRAALNEADRPTAKEKGKKAEKVAKPTLPKLGWGDVAIVAGLNVYAKELNLPEESKLFEKLTQQVLSCCQTE